MLMTLNQLFCKRPDNHILEILMDCFKLENIEDTTIFTKKDLAEYGTVEKINNNRNDFKKYYLPCKGKKYLSDLNEKKVMTILKQFVKTFNYYVFSKEKYIDGEKFITYQVVPVDQKSILKLKKKDEKYIVTFD
jgi:hypothetical protein